MFCILYMLNQPYFPSGNYKGSVKPTSCLGTSSRHSSILNLDESSIHYCEALPLRNDPAFIVLQNATINLRGRFTPSDMYFRACTSSLNNLKCWASGSLCYKKTWKFGIIRAADSLKGEGVNGNRYPEFRGPIYQVIVESAETEIKVCKL